MEKFKVTLRKIDDPETVLAQLEKADTFGEAIDKMNERAEDFDPKKHFLQVDSTREDHSK